MAYNRVLEASVYTPSGLQGQSRMMAVASVFLVVTAVGGSQLPGLGDTVLVRAMR